MRAFFFFFDVFTYYNISIENNFIFFPMSDIYVRGVLIGVADIVMWAREM